MNHDQLVSYVQRMRTQELTGNNFDEFVIAARSVFEPNGTQLHLHSRVGKNSSTEDMFKDGKRPDWNVFEKKQDGYDKLTTKEFVIRSRDTPGPDGRFLVVYFNESLGHEVFGMRHTPPLRFAYDLGKSLYVADHGRNGTPKFPYEDLYLRQ